MRKIAFIIEDGFFSGMPLQALRYARAFKSHGVDVLCVYATENKLFGEHAKAYGLFVKECKLIRFRGSLNPLKQLKAILSFPMAIHRLAAILRRFEVSEVHIIGAHCLLGGIAAKILNIKTVVYLGGRLNDINPLFAKILYSIWNKIADIIIPNCEAVLQDFIKSIPNSKKCISVVPNLIDTSLYKPSLKSNRIVKEFELEPTTKVVTLIGSIYPLKGIHIYLQSIDFLNGLGVHNIQYWLIGERLEAHKDYFLKISHMVSEMSLNKCFKYLGVREDISEILSCTDILVVPSFSEGLPNVILEAQACCVPVIASDVGGIPELISHQQTGLLVTPGDWKALGHAIINLLRNDDLRSIIVKNAYNNITKKYDPSVVVDKILNLKMIERSE